MNKLNKLLNLSASIAHDCSAKYISSDHILCAMFQLNDTTNQFLNSYTKKHLVEEKLMKGLGYLKVEGFSQEAENVLDRAKEIAKEYRFYEILPFHILLAMLDIKINNRAAKILFNLSINLFNMKSELVAFFKSFDLDNKNINIKKDIEDQKEENLNNNINSLDDITKKAEKGLIQEVIGRDEEIERIVQVLTRRGKNNPILLGDPGVGKTAIIEGLALKIVKGDIIESLKNKRIMSLDISSLLSGTQYRGQFEERLKNLLNYLKSNNDIILFIDEIHMIMGAGTTDNSSIDIANMLKPMLARGEIPTIGATTYLEYQKYIEKDPALERRFSPITINETSRDDTIKILKALKLKYEMYYNVYITDEAIINAVDLSIRYITDRYLPDKAIDLLDETCSNIALNSTKIREIEQIEFEIKELELLKLKSKNSNDNKNKTEIENKLIKLNKELYLNKQIKETHKLYNSIVFAEDIANVLSKITGIKLNSISKEEKENILNLDKTIKKQIIGQDQAVDVIVNAIKRSRTGLRDANKPIGSFLFVGPTGVGKTELAKILAKELFGSKDNIIRFDMSEYADKNSVSKLIGSAPGYVGFEEGGKLTNQVKNKPFSLILFDEIEKAHIDLFDIFLQILDEGRLTDSKGKTVNFKNTIIILTSNIGAKKIQQNLNNNLINKREINLLYLQEVKNYIKPELINRLDDIVIFNNLKEEDISKIVYLEISKLIKKLDNKGINIKFQIDAFKLLVKLSKSDEYGARKIKRIIENRIVNEISNKILMCEFKKGDTIIVSKSKFSDNFNFNKK